MDAIKTFHRFIDEAGDTTFYNSKNKFIVGTEGVSKAFCLGMLKIKEPLKEVRNRVVELQKEIENDNYLNTIPSVKKRMKIKDSFFFHCKDDSPEVREKLMKFIKNLDCEFEMVVARKSYLSAKRIIDSDYIYSEVLSHLLKNHLSQNEKLVLNIASRGKTTKNKTLNEAIMKAKNWYVNNPKNQKEIRTSIKINVQDQHSEPLLNLADYLCWSVQRVFEKGETRHYNYLKEKISFVLDLYDKDKYDGFMNYYGWTHHLTESNML